jgi:hypothetical protein
MRLRRMNPPAAAAPESTKFPPDQGLCLVRVRAGPTAVVLRSLGRRATSVARAPVP